MVWAVSQLRLHSQDSLQHGFFDTHAQKVVRRSTLCGLHEGVDIKKRKKAILCLYVDSEWCTRNTLITQSHHKRWDSTVKLWSEYIQWWLFRFIPLLTPLIRTRFGSLDFLSKREVWRSLPIMLSVSFIEDVWSSNVHKYSRSGAFSDVIFTSALHAVRQWRITCQTSCASLWEEGRAQSYWELTTSWVNACVDQEAFLVSVHGTKMKITAAPLRDVDEGRPPIITLRLVQCRNQTHKQPGAP